MSDGNSETNKDFLERAYDGASAAVSEKKRQLAELLKGLDPLEAMLRAVWYSRQLALMRTADSSDDKACDPFVELAYNNANLIPEYLQSCLLSIAACGNKSSDSDLTAMCLEKMIACADSIVATLNESMLLRFSKVYTAGKETGLSEAVLRYQIEAKAYQPLRGKRYHAIEEDYLTILLGKQDDLIRRVYGIGSKEVIAGHLALMRSLTLGWSDAIWQLSEQCENWIRKNNDPFEGVSKEEAAIIAESAFGYRLHDVCAVTNWPESLVDDLSLSAASVSDLESFESIDPLGLLPIANKPFIKIGGKSYCFCVANYLDNFYRTFYRAIRDRYVLDGIGSNSEFAVQWKDRQASASEEGVAELINKLLPNSNICINGYHPSRGINWNKHDCQESDLVVVYGDALLAIEVKAGAFCPTDPADDSEGHVKSFTALLEKASRQAESTVDYVRRCCGGPCRFYDSSGRVKFEFEPSIVRTVFKVCVTVDDFNEFASKADKLGFIEMANGTIALSIDDLLVYSKYFDNPLVFLHYLIQRRAAANMPALYMNDELDHLGMYISNNCYVATIDRLAAESNLDYRNDPNVRIQGFLGFRESLDAWFEGMFVGEPSAKPVQESPQIFNAVIDMLNNERLGYWRRAVASTFLNCGSGDRKSVSDGIATRLGPGFPSDLRLELRAQDSGDVPLSVFVDRNEDPNNDEICRQKSWAVLLRDQEPLAIRLDIHASNGSPTSLDLVEYKAENLSEEDKKHAMRFVEALGEIRKRCIRVQTGRKIGRNEPCPCGSGKKYKKCCGR